MSRLLFAAARGARIQFLNKQLNIWCAAPGFINANIDRIHPEDTHLQYGPISTELRVIAADPNSITTDALSAELAEECVSFLNATGRAFMGYRDFTPEHRAMFCLIVAEYLADQGM